MIYRVASQGREICPSCHFENTAGFRMKGLLGRSALSGEEGILIKPCNSIHMFFMRFPIDAIFLDGSNRVVKIYAGIKPWRISGIHFNAASVLEVAAGVAAKANLQLGDSLTFEERSAEA